jgi:hypothetical protein
MQKSFYIRMGFILFALVAASLFAETESDKLKKNHSPSDNTPTASRIIDVNNMEMWVQSDGTFGENPYTGGDGLYYPKGQRNHSLVYTSHIWLGAMVNDSLRIMFNQFGNDAQSGCIQGNGEPYGRMDEQYHVYKINIGDNASTNPDYAQWPVDQGAPINNSGNPKHIGDQTLWCSFTDGYPYRIGRSGTYDRFTPPLKAECHITVFGFEDLNDVLFLSWDIINKSENDWKDTYVAIWSDCELGFANDDLVGSDSTLALVFDYNDGDDRKYGSNPPAFGYVFLNTPSIPSISDSTFNGTQWINGLQNLHPKSPMIFKHDNNTYPGWDGGDGFRKAEHPYLRMQCLNFDGEPMINPLTGNQTDWCFTGNPVEGSGWLGTFSVDRRFMLSAGPFNMAPGDTQSIAMAIVVGQGVDPLSSINVLKLNARKTWSIFLNGYNGPWTLPLPETRKGEYNSQCILTWDHHQICYSTSALQSFQNMKHEFEGYNIYQGETSEGPWHRIATYDFKNGITIIWDMDYSETLGFITEIPVAHGSDSGVQHFHVIDHDYQGRPLVNGKSYYFAVSGYFYNPNGIIKVRESEKSIIEAVPQRPVLDTQYTYSHGDTLFTETDRCYVIAIDPGRITGDTYDVEVEEIEGELFWYLTNITTGETRLDEWDHFGTDNSFPIVDGFMVKVTEEAQDGDRFTFSTTAPQKSADIARSRLDDINVFPNPYFGQNTAESDFYGQFVTFNNLPEKCTIRIFSLSGVLVKTIRHNNGTPFEKWYVMNENQLAIAGGMYIVHVRTEFGDKILKFAFINREARYLHL